MLHHERLRPPSHDYPADVWNVIENVFHPEFLAQLETMLTLGNGYQEGSPNAENATLVNGFMKRGRSSTQRKPTVSRRLARQFATSPTIKSSSSSWMASSCVCRDISEY
jgi:hypothetical protein